MRFLLFFGLNLHLQEWRQRTALEKSIAWDHEERRFPNSSHLGEKLLHGELPGKRHPRNVPVDACIVESARESLHAQLHVWLYAWGPNARKEQWGRCFSWHRQACLPPGCLVPSRSAARIRDWWLSTSATTPGCEATFRTTASTSSTRALWASQHPYHNRDSSRGPSRSRSLLLLALTKSVSQCLVPHLNNRNTDPNTREDLCAQYLREILVSYQVCWSLGWVLGAI